MNETQAVTRAALALNALASAVLAEQKAARMVAFEVQQESGAKTVEVRDDDGEVLGTSSLTKGRMSARVADPDAYTAWVAKRYPDQMRGTCDVCGGHGTVPADHDTAAEPFTPSAAFTERLLNVAKEYGAGVGYDPESGEVVPGIEVSEGTPGITVRPNAAAKERMRALLADAGLLALPEAPDA